MIEKELNALKDSILNFIGTDKIDNAYYASFVYTSDGEFIVCENYDDSKLLNFDDSLGRYFYIRILEPAKAEKSEMQASSCSYSFDLIVPIRLVAYIPNGIVDNIVSLFHSALANYSSQISSVNSYSLETNKYAIYRQETIEQAINDSTVGMPDLSKVSMVMFDMELFLRLKTSNKACLNLPICEC